MKLNEKGITLVELIAAVALVSILATAAWTTLFIGMQHGTAETEKTILQQDANLIIATLMAEHRVTDKYSIIFEDDKMKINSYDESTATWTLKEIEARYDFTGTIVNGAPVDFTSGSPVVMHNLLPKQAHTKITLKITDLSNRKRTLSMETTLTRLLTD